MTKSTPSLLPSANIFPPESDIGVEPVRYSVVAPMHNEEGNVAALYQDIKQVMEKLGEAYEIIFVNDASNDRTLAKMVELQARDRHFHFADLAGNVGENWALLAGISRARGEVIITIDGDYQNDPAYIPSLLEELGKGYRVVSGWRRNRTAALWSRQLPSRVANSLIRLVSGVDVHDCGCGLKAYRREVVAGKFVPKGFMNRFSPVSLGVKGDQFSEVEIVDRARIAGASHYGLSRVFVVMRDLWVLPFAIRDAGRWLPIFQVLIMTGLLAALVALFLGRWGAATVIVGFTLLAASNALNLRRFIEAQLRPPFRIADYR